MLKSDDEDIFDVDMEIAERFIRNTFDVVVKEPHRICGVIKSPLPCFVDSFTVEASQIIINGKTIDVLLKGRVELDKTYPSNVINRIVTTWNTKHRCWIHSLEEKEVKTINLVDYMNPHEHKDFELRLLDFVLAISDFGNELHLLLIWYILQIKLREIYGNECKVFGKQIIIYKNTSNASSIQKLFFSLVDVDLECRASVIKKGYTMDASDFIKTKMKPLGTSPKISLNYNRLRNDETEYSLTYHFDNVLETILCEDDAKRIIGDFIEMTNQIDYWDNF